MQYSGGKQKSGGDRIAAVIAQYAARVGTRDIVETMCGGLSVTYRLKPFNVQARDACRHLITLYRELQRGWEPPAEVDRGTWEKYKLDPDPDDPMTAFCGFGCSYSGAWFSSFISSYKYTKRRVPAATAARDSLRKKMLSCSSVEFVAGDFADAPLRGVQYCDKPYIDSLDYPAVAPFEHDRFWKHATEISTYIPVIVSERVAPAPFVAIDEWSVQQRLTTSSGTRRIERLFVHESWI